jgi:hypothetical protein
MVLRQQTEPFAAVAAQPFKSLPAERLASDGYIQRDGPNYTFYAPTPAVLLSSEFENTHCFGLRRSAARPDMIGVTFEPSDDASDVPGIAGTAWLDVDTHALRTVDFHYVNAPDIDYVEDASGFVDFTPVPLAGWVVSSWRITTPALAVVNRVNNRLGGTRVTEFLQQGGRVTTASVAGRDWPLENPGTIEGIALDSTRSGSPLGDARIALRGTTISTQSDASGQFRFDNIPPGDYTLELVHTRLDSLPAYPGFAPAVHVRSDDVAHVTVAIPPLSRSILAQCTATDVARREELQHQPAFGVARDSLSGARLPRIALRFAWQNIGLVGETLTSDSTVVRTATDDRGRFHICHVPPQQRVIVMIESDSSQRYNPVVLHSARTPTFWSVEFTAATSTALAGNATANPRAADVVDLGALEVTAKGSEDAAPGTMYAGYPVSKRGARLAGSNLLRLEENGTSMISALRNLSGIRIRNTREGDCVEASRTLGRIAGASSCDPPAVILDGVVLMNGIAQLLTTPLSAIESIEYLTAIEATIRWPNLPNGAIVIWTRGFGPHKSAERTGKGK